jgi:competence protein ComEC
MSTLVVLFALAGYVAVVDDRPPIFRAALMAAAFLLGRLLYRRTDLLNAVGLAALVILAFRPSEVRDASFLLSFLAAGTIGAIAVPLLDRTTGKYLHALDHVGDVTRDAAYEPRVTQFRLDLRVLSNWLESRLPDHLARFAPAAVIVPLRGALWAGDLILLSLTLQAGMLPLMARYFHRFSVVAPASNVPAVLLTGIIVPCGFAVLSASLVWPAFARWLGIPLSKAIGALLAVIHFLHAPHGSPTVSPRRRRHC